MNSNRLSPSSFKPGQVVPSKGPRLKRADSFPTHPSQKPEPAEVNPVRHPITRPKPDARPPIDFQETGPGRMGEAAMDAAAVRKIQALADDAQKYGALERKLSRDPEAMELVKSRHPDYDRYTDADKAICLSELTNHPRFAAEFAQARNEVSSLPNRATGTRMMRWDEQVFLTNAHEVLHEEFQKNPFRIHGETGMVGDREGRIIEMRYSPTKSVSTDVNPGDRYQLHTHPPLGEPFTSSASGADHVVAAENYLHYYNKADTYLSNGKDVLHISPTSMELTRLIPDPRAEARLVEFPVAFTVPKPEDPPYPFSNYEAPATFNPWDRTK